MSDQHHGSGVLRLILKVLEITGYVCIGWLASSVVAAFLLWITGGFPPVGKYNVHWQGHVGTVLGYGGISTLITIPIWLALCLIPRLRWQRAWWWALVPANAVTITATLAAFLRQAG